MATRNHLEPGECNRTPTLTMRSVTSAGRRGMGNTPPPPPPPRSLYTQCRMPLFGHTCGKCGKRDHANRVCRSKQPSTENAIFGTCCDITTHRVRQCRTLDHHVFDSTNDRWVKRQSLPQPTRHLLFQTIMTNCLAGTHILRQLGLSRSPCLNGCRRRTRVGYTSLAPS